MNDTSNCIIAASSVSVKTMADDTLRLTLDIEPRHAQTAFALFGKRGSTVALAALNVGTTLPEPEPEKPKGGPLARWAAMRCNDQRFCKWFDTRTPGLASQRIKAICGIQSRAELDSNPEAADKFRRQVMQPWSNYCEQMGWKE